MHTVRNTWANCAPGLKWKFIVSLVAILIGLIFVALGISLNFYLDHALDEGIKDFLVVDSKDSSGYEKWEFNGVPDKTPQYMKYYLWNLTNADEISNTTAYPQSVPQYERVGPFVYRRLIQKVNVTFVDNGDEVYYAQYIYYKFDESQSVASPDDPSLMVTNLNSAYLAVLAKVGSEQNLVRAVIGPSLLTLFNTLSQPFGLIVGEVITSQVLPVVRSAVLQGIEQTYNVSADEAAEIFATTWANETEPEPALWGTLGVLSQGGFPSNLSTTVVDALWDSQSPLPTLVNSTYTSAFLWFAATYLQQPTAIQTLAQAFGLDLAQLQMVLAWRSKFLFSATVLNYVNQTFGVTNLNDLFYLQWGEGVVTNGTSVQQLLASSSAIPPLVGIPEFAIWSQKFGSGTVKFNVTFSKTLLNGTAGLFDATNVGTFLYLVSTGNAPALAQMFQLSMAQAIEVAQYLTYIGNTFVDAALKQAFAAGGGLITTKTPQAWLWGAEDPLLQLLGQVPSTVALANNMTSAEAVLDGKSTSLVYTGKDNIDDIASYIDYCGVSVYPAGTLWAQDEVVDGTEGIQFRPSLKKDVDLIVWNYELMRQIPIHYDEDVSLKGIDLYRYHVSRQFFLPNPKYYQTITGFANMTGVYSNVPIFISKPNMLDCEADWRDKVAGMMPSDADDTVIDVEPYTGLTMNVAKQLQINIYLQNASSPLDLYNQNILKEVIYPVFYANQKGTISDSEADDFKDKVYLLLTVRVVVFWVGVSVGAALAALGLVLLIFVILRNRAYGGGYEVIGEQFQSGSDGVFTPSRSRDAKNERREEGEA